MREVAVAALLWDRSPLLSQDADRAFVKLVDQRPVIGAGALALLVRPGEVEIWLPGEEIEPPRKRLRVSAVKA